MLGPHFSGDDICSVDAFGFHAGYKWLQFLPRYRRPMMFCELPDASKCWVPAFAGMTLPVTNGSSFSRVSCGMRRGLPSSVMMQASTMPWVRSVLPHQIFWSAVMRAPVSDVARV